MTIEIKKESFVVDVYYLVPDKHFTQGHPDGENRKILSDVALEKFQEVNQKMAEHFNCKAIARVRKE